MFTRVRSLAQREWRALMRVPRRFPAAFLISLLIVPVTSFVYEPDAYSIFSTYICALCVSVPVQLHCRRRALPEAKGFVLALCAAAVSAALYALLDSLYVFYHIAGYETLIVFLLCAAASYPLVRTPGRDLRLIASLTIRFFLCLAAAFAVIFVILPPIRLAPALLAWAVLGLIFVSLPVNLFLAGVPDMHSRT